MTLAQTMSRRLSLPPTLAGPLLFVASIAVALGVFSANLADLDGILFRIAVLPASLALVMIAEEWQGPVEFRKWLGLAIAAAGLAVIAWSAFQAWEEARQFAGSEFRYFLRAFLPYVAIGLLPVMAGLSQAGAISDRMSLTAGTIVGFLLAVTSIATAIAFWTADDASGQEAKTALAVLVLPLAFSVVVIFSALRHSADVGRSPYLPALAAVSVIVVAVSSGIWSAATAEHRVIGDFFNATPPPPDVTMPERLYAFASLTVLPLALAVLIFATGRQKRSARVVTAGGLLLSVAFAVWAAMSPSVVPVPGGSVWMDIRFISSPFWVFAGVLVWHVSVYALAFSRTQRQSLSE